MIRHWFTKADAPLTTCFIKRFEPRHFTVDFPRGAIASAVSGPTSDSLRIVAEFQRKNDLVGLIYTSSDDRCHPVGRRKLSRDYRHCKLSFQWAADGLPGLDEVYGATLTIEGRDAAGASKIWYVRLWNYADGTPTHSKITLDFDSLSGGFNLDDGADSVYAGDIDRMFFSLVPVGYDPSGAEPFSQLTTAVLELSDIRCEGSGSVIEAGDAWVPEHDLRMCTAYDDLYHLVPARVVEMVERLGYRKIINHYVGMSHHQGLGSEGLVDPARPLNAAAAAWHAGFAEAARNAGFEIIFSLSFEIIASACPAAWQQLASDGTPARTGYEPPSALVSPANSDAVGYLADTAVAFARLADEAGLRPRIQIGEPWWWVTDSFRPCLYDPAARAIFGSDVVVIDDVRGSKNAAEIALLDRAGVLLAAATHRIVAAVKVAYAESLSYLLIYTPAILGGDRPEWHRANIPVGWSFPKFDVLQLEDYEWLTSNRQRSIEAADRFIDDRLSYPPYSRHYLAGFAAAPSAALDWQAICAGAQGAIDGGAAEVFIWALPQILRDSATLFDDGQTNMDAFADEPFPVALGAEASVVPEFLTTVLTSSSGHEFRNSNWSQARLRFDAGAAVRGEDELKTLLAFFRARRGSAQAFRFTDPYDHTSNAMTEMPTASDQQIGIGDGSTTEFALLKNYGKGEQRRITRPQAASVRVAVDGEERTTGWVVGPLGTVKFDDPPASGAVITSGFLFDVPVRFADDHLQINRATFLAGETPTIPLIEVREDV